jgi:SulP family sulfate permease
MSVSALRQEWASNIRGDVLAGMTVALALIPETIAFSLIAGVDPMVGLYASFCIAVVIAFAGGRPGMISAATGSMALVMVVLVAEHGLEYLLTATLLTGALQFILGLMKVGRSHVWDQSAVAAIAKVREKYRQQGKSVYVTGLNSESQRTLDRGFS